MVLTVDNDTQKIIATLHNGDRIEKFECRISACQNPVCTCGTAYLYFIPILTKNGNARQLSPRNVEIDIGEKSLGYRDKKKIPKEDLEFGEFFLSECDEDDFKILYEWHFEFKNKITEEADIDAIDGDFEYDEVEYNGLMYAYNDVLPYGDQLNITLNGRECIVFDQYCLLPHCSCTDTILNIFSIDKIGKTGEELCVVSLKYKKKKWETIEKGSPSLDLNSVRSAIEAQHPNIYKLFQKRHVKLKTIYSHCKKRHYGPEQKLQLPKVGRNDPCPCGSGIKYKKCCLTRSK